LRHVMLGLATGVLLTVFSYLMHAPSETFQALLVFNTFFVCMLFPLEGSLKRKMTVLFVGNLACFAWNTLFSMFTGAAIVYVGEGFKALVAFLNSLLNLLWIVSFWSISLAFLRKHPGGR